MLLASKSLLRYSSLSSLFLCLEKTDPTRPLVFQVFLRLSAVVLEEHPVSNGNVWKLEKHDGVRRWEPQEEAKIWDDRILQTGLEANPRTWALPVSMWRFWSGTSWNKSSRYPSLTGSPIPKWIGCTETMPTFIKSIFPGGRCWIMQSNTASQR